MINFSSSYITLAVSRLGSILNLCYQNRERSNWLVVLKMEFRKQNNLIFPHERMKGYFIKKL